MGRISIECIHLMPHTTQTDFATRQQNPFVYFFYLLAMFRHHLAYI